MLFHIIVVSGTEKLVSKNTYYMSFSEMCDVLPCGHVNAEDKYNMQSLRDAHDRCIIANQPLELFVLDVQLPVNLEVLPRGHVNAEDR